MSQIVLQGDTSGQTVIQAPSTGTQTVTLPAATGTALVNPLPTGTSISASTGDIVRFTGNGVSFPTWTTSARPPGPGTGATATFSVSGGVVQTVTITNQGSNYVNGATISFPGGSTAASATLTTTGGVVNTTVTNLVGGTGYSNGTFNATITGIPYTGQTGYNTTLSVNETYNGTSWVPVATSVNSSVTVSDLETTTINGGQIAGNRNRIINGAMAIDQRNAGAAQTITAAAALAYTVDRFYAYCTGANVTGQRVTGANAGQYRYQFTGAASVTGISFGQRIETLNSADLAGNTVTLGVDLANSLLTTVTWTAYYANTTDAFGTVASPTRTSIATGTFTVTSTVNRYNAQISIPSAAVTGIEIALSVGAQTSGTWTIGNVQLELGSIATPFERKSYGQELALCQRYYLQYNASATPNALGALSGYTTTVTNSIIFTIPLPTILRVTPVLTLGGTNTNYFFATGATAMTSTTLTVYSYYQNILYCNLTGYSGGVDGYAGVMSIRNTLTISCEL